MKRHLSLLAVLVLLSLSSNAQTYWKAGAGKGDVVWEYDFAVPVSKSIQEVNVSSESTISTQGFLPQPTSGTVAVRTYTSSNPNANPAGFLLSGSCATSSLTMIATSGPSTAPAASAATSRFAAYGFANATSVMSLHFNMGLSAAPSNTNANWYFMIGGNSYPGILTRNDNNMTTSSANYADDNRIFGAYRLIKSTQTGSFVHTTMQKASSTVVTRDWIGASPASLVANTSYKIDIFCNNSTSQQTYIMNGTEYDLEVGKYVIYVDGTLKATLDKIAFTSSQNLRSFMIMSRDGAQSGAGNYDNSAALTISNFKVVHLGTVSTTPVTLTSFDGEKTNEGIALNWKTASESKNSHFILNRSVNGSDFSYLARIEGKGNTSNTSAYNYTDNNPFSGTNYYRLEQVDTDGAKTLINHVVSVKYAVPGNIFTVSASSANQLKVNISSDKNQKVEFYITDISGKRIYKSNEVLKQGINQIDVFVSSVKPGVYVATLKGSGNTRSVKFIL